MADQKKKLEQEIRLRETGLRDLTERENGWPVKGGGPLACRRGWRLSPKDYDTRLQGCSGGTERIKLEAKNRMNSAQDSKAENVLTTKSSRSRNRNGTVGRTATGASMETLRIQEIAEKPSRDPPSMH